MTIIDIKEHLNYIDLLCFTISYNEKILRSFFPRIYVRKSHHGAPKLSVESSVESYNIIFVKINESYIEK